MAAAVTILPKRMLPKRLPKRDLGVPRSRLGKLKDSKQLSLRQREEWYRVLQKEPSIQWGIGKVSESVIDRINIYQATRFAMERAVKNLESKLQLQMPSISSHGIKLRIIDFLFIDGAMEIDSPIPQKAIIKGDETIALCAMASIVAKVKRDRLMVSYHKRYPQYGFDRHKGYGTELHRAMLKKHGPCNIHRKTFYPVASLMKLRNP